MLEQRWIQAPQPMFVADTNGNTASFDRGEVKQLPGSLAIEAMKAGAMAVHGPEGVIDTNPDLYAPVSDDVREAIHIACIALRSEGDPKKFTNNGRPKIAEVIALITEFDKEHIKSDIVSDVWNEITG